MGFEMNDSDLQLTRQVVELERDAKRFRDLAHYTNLEDRHFPRPQRNLRRVTDLTREFVEAQRDAGRWRALCQKVGRTNVEELLERLTKLHDGRTYTPVALRRAEFERATGIKVAGV